MTAAVVAHAVCSEAGGVLAALAQVGLRGTRSLRRTAFPAEGIGGLSTPEAAS